MALFDVGVAVCSSVAAFGCFIADIGIATALYTLGAVAAAYGAAVGVAAANNAAGIYGVVISSVFGKFDMEFYIQLLLLVLVVLLRKHLLKQLVQVVPLSRHQLCAVVV